ncbi:MAG: hypothetical protein ACYC20_09325 [Sulfurovum sp.]
MCKNRMHKILQTISRFNYEGEFTQRRHKEILKNGYLYYNPNLTLDRENFSLAN